MKKCDYPFKKFFGYKLDSTQLAFERHGAQNAVCTNNKTKQIPQYQIKLHNRIL